MDACGETFQDGGFHSVAERKTVVLAMKTTRARILLLAAILGVGNVAAWLWALLVFRDHPLLLGTAAVAYGLGLRHAVDADHIAAIDNVTRKLRQQDQYPVAVGFFFSLGHSTVVVLATIGIVLGTAAFHDRFAGWHAIGGAIATAVSAAFLFTIAAVNVGIAVQTVRHMRRSRKHGTMPIALPEITGPLSRVLRPVYRLIGRSWHMYPLGMLFGLSFDTSSEIALLGISATEATNGLPLWSILVLPALFTAAMSLVDTADGVMMLGAYDWAYVRPMRKLYYNFAITFLSALIAIGVGGVEVLGLVMERFNLSGAFWSAIEAASSHLGVIGAAIIVLLATAWTGAVLLSRLRGEHRSRPV